VVEGSEVGVICLAESAGDYGRSLGALVAFGLVLIVGALSVILKQQGDGRD
jgi:hypothetical protein